MFMSLCKRATSNKPSNYSKEHEDIVCTQTRIRQTRGRKQSLTAQPVQRCVHEGRPAALAKDTQMRHTPRNRNRDPLATSTALLLRGRIDARADDEGVPLRRLDRVHGRFERLGRDDAVDVYGSLCEYDDHYSNKLVSIPVRIVWNAPSTFDASSAEVSMKDSPFSATIPESAFHHQTNRHKHK